MKVTSRIHPFPSVSPELSWEDARIIQNLQNADATIVETEAAKENLQKFLAYYGLINLQQKISVVSNPVTEDILTAKIPTS